MSSISLEETTQIPELQRYLHLRKQECKPSLLRQQKNVNRAFHVNKKGRKYKKKENSSIRVKQNKITGSSKLIFYCRLTSSHSHNKWSQVRWSSF